MKIIGITGGIGAGKSEILSYIQKKYRARVILADQVANDMKKPGGRCYEAVISVLGDGILAEDKTIDKAKMAQVIFGNQEKLAAVNELVHPAVKQYILEEIAAERAFGGSDWLFIEAALLIEEHYDEIADELWYVYAPEDVRRRRLKESRGYSDGKISAIMKRQLPETVFKEKCRFVIDNSGGLEKAYEQIDCRMEG